MAYTPYASRLGLSKMCTELHNRLHHELNSLKLQFSVVCIVNHIFTRDKWGSSSRENLVIDVCIQHIGYTLNIDKHI